MNTKLSNIMSELSSDYNVTDNHKYNNYMIISSKHKTPPYNWTDNIFNKHLPVSGNYKLGDSNCGNNKTGRGYYANPCGYWDNTKGHINSGTHIKNISLTGSLFPTNYGNHVIVPPNDIVVHPYTRIGEEYRSR